MINKKIDLVCIVGPTASGKTSLSIELASMFNGEIISADSMQLYRGIHIASAAPDEEEKRGIPHHLIEVLDCGEKCTVADYVELASNAIAQVNARGKLPIIVGGTGLYIDSLIQGIQFVPQKTDYDLRRKLEEEYETYGGEEMLRRLSLVDFEASQKLHPNDRRRIIRAFEIYRSTGSTKTQADINSRNEEMPYNVLMLGLNFQNRDILYDRINMRVDLMLEKGLLKEAEKTFSLSDNGGAAQAIGHKELYPFLSGEITLEVAADNLKQATRRYAKRQLTWFRKNEKINWILADVSIKPVDEAAEIIRKWRDMA